MSQKNLVLAIPSKGRLKEETLNIFSKVGFQIKKNGNERGYLGQIEGLKSVEVIFSSASEIPYQLRSGRVHLGVTGEDLVRETVYYLDQHIDFVTELGFGHANVVVAVPECWLDVNNMQDLEEVTTQFYEHHGRRVKVATKYMNITRSFFSSKGITGYRIVESLGATEGVPASGGAELIVDITSTGETLKANNLKILNDGIILKSQANLISSKKADWSSGTSEIYQTISRKISEFVKTNK